MRAFQERIASLQWNLGGQTLSSAQLMAMGYRISTAEGTTFTATPPASTQNITPMGMGVVTIPPGARAPISPEVAKVAFHPASKEGTYSYVGVTPKGTLYATPLGAWQLFYGGQIAASGSAGSLQAILENPERYHQDAERMGLTSVVRTTEQVNQALGTPATTKTVGGITYTAVSFPTGKTAEQGRQLVYQRLGNVKDIVPVTPGTIASGVVPMETG